MDQNPEVLNRAINEALKKVDGAQRIRGVRTIVIGGILFLLSFAPSIAKALAGGSGSSYINLIISISILVMIYGGILLVFGVKARAFYQRYINKDYLARASFYTFLIVLIVFFMFLISSFFSNLIVEHQ